MGYEPPFTITTKAVGLVADIAEAVSRMSVEGLTINSRLRRINRLKSIQSSLAIENNSLTFSQVSDVIDGKPVFGNPREIQEVKNAFAAYEMMEGLDPCSLDDLLRIHGVMMNIILDDAGRFRRSGVGVFSGDRLVHMAPPSDNVYGLITELMDWLRTSDVHPLVKGCVFHYEFEFIHPFSDGNGRTGRLWHTLILSKWRESMKWIPIETLVREHQTEYYDAIETSTKLGDSAPFIELMLSLILEAVRRTVSQELSDGADGLSTIERRLLSMIEDGIYSNSAGAAEALSVSERTIERVIRSLKDKGRIVREGGRKTGRWHIVDNSMSE